MLKLPETLQLDDIKTIIPHREPFLMVDRVEGIEMNKACTAYRTVSHDEWFFKGHFPGYPVMPGVMIIEAMAQAAGVLAFATLKNEEANCRTDCVFFTSVENARFRKPVNPGDTMRMVITVEQRRGDRFWKFKGMTFVGEALTDEASFTAMIPDNKA
ncbi:MAG: 3-hydroxyacyl-ACP dehydratase FabZ [Holosporales bacterium]|jgi:3-hydroxyacyl-[acyl-carrier-protein] dehydratase|nr:3-hydroxyacyl-ACP dehydratase FabZ [Holosporales bacterium]